MDDGGGGGGHGDEVAGETRRGGGGGRLLARCRRSAGYFDGRRPMERVCLLNATVPRYVSTFTVMYLLLSHDHYSMLYSDPVQNSF